MLQAIGYFPQQMTIFSMVSAAVDCGWPFSGGGVVWFSRASFAFLRLGRFFGSCSLVADWRPRVIDYSWSAVVGAWLAGSLLVAAVVVDCLVIRSGPVSTVCCLLQL